MDKRKRKSDLHKKLTAAYFGHLCTVTLNGRKFRVGLFDSKEAGGICTEVKGKKPGQILVGINEGQPIVVALHEFLHGWFQHRLSEREVARLTTDLWKSIAKFQEALLKHNAKRRKAVRRG